MRRTTHLDHVDGRQGRSHSRGQGQQHGYADSAIQQLTHTTVRGGKIQRTTAHPHEAAQGADHSFSFTQCQHKSFGKVVSVSETTSRVLTAPFPRPTSEEFRTAGAATGASAAQQVPMAPKPQDCDRERQKMGGDAVTEQGPRLSSSDSAEIGSRTRPKRKSTRSRRSYHYDSDDDEFDYPTSKKRGSGVAFEPPIEKKTKSATKAYIRGKTCRTKGRFCRVCGNKDAIQWRRGPDGRLSSFVKQEKHIPVNKNPSRISVASLLQSGAPGPVTRPG